MREVRIWEKLQEFAAVVNRQIVIIIYYAGGE